MYNFPQSLRKYNALTLCHKEENTKVKDILTKSMSGWCKLRTWEKKTQPDFAQEYPSK